LWTRFYQLLFPISTLNDSLPKLSHSSLNASITPKTQTAQSPKFEGTRNPADSTIEEVRVDMADMKVEKRPVSLITNVGSCVAICIHDPINKCGGLAHIMLPDSRITSREILLPKYADTAVPALIEAVRKNGGRFSLSAKIAGGANMFPNLKGNTMNIGLKNVEAVKEALTANRVKLIAEDVRGNHGRKIIFNISDGSVSVRGGNGEVKEL
jgi:chemotaxis protein CheD